MNSIHVTRTAPVNLTPAPSSTSDFHRLISGETRPLLARGLARCGLALMLVFGVAASVHAQSPATARIIGRIFNPATQEYVRHAEVTVEGTDLTTVSGDDGTYVLSNVPENAIATENSDSYYDLNRDFHTRIVAISNNSRLIDFTAITEREVFLFLRRGATSRPRMSNQQHLEILNAIAAGDEAGAARAFETHIITGKQRMLDTLA